ncbi:DNA polymerase [uncultured Muribaculum sp.]|uniref:DNA polymerase n=1 Tax=uncultured Muribaculum sp. TaxID=1918613 RepID=UPI0025AF7729|nr:DNA polymerase [uncultured Muribaculum sp.]
MRELGIDIETYSSRDLSKCGVYKYVEAPDFAVLLFAYSVDNAPAVIVDFAQGEELPGEIMDALINPDVVKTAWNAAFERICLTKHFGLSAPLDPAQWKCTMVRAARMGLPLSLGQCGEVLKLADGKMAEGKTLIRFFSVPGRNGVRHLPSAAPDRWETFKKYCIRDVDVEQALLAKLRRLEPAEFDEELYIADQEINDRGVLIDRELVDAAARFDVEYKAELLKEAQKLTGMENPNSAAQIKEYLKRETGVMYASINKKNIDEIEGALTYWPKARRVMAIRREMAKTSNKKYEAMQTCVCDDGRIHGLLQFCGAARTGRWAGRLVQVQNLPQNHLADLDFARSLVKAGDLEEFEMNYANVTQVLSELIRTAFIAAPGHILHVCDFSAIEARVIAWIAGENWVLDVFREGGDIYCATASRMFGVPVEKHGPNAHLRQKGKISVLALGYGGGVPALEAMGGSKLGLSEKDKKDTVRQWRDANPKIVRLWAVVEKAAFTAIKTGNTVTIHRGITVGFRWGMLLITLPSGRTICYPRAKVSIEYNDGWRGDHEIIEYEGLNQTTKKWETLRTYGGKLVENIVQATARDILGIVMLRARRADLPIVFHVHDEIIAETPINRPLADVEALFSEPIEWCRDLPLKGAGYSTPYYLKD